MNRSLKPTRHLPQPQAPLPLIFLCVESDTQVVLPAPRCARASRGLSLLSLLPRHQWQQPLGALVVQWAPSPPGFFISAISKPCSRHREARRCPFPNLLIGLPFVIFRTGALGSWAWGCRAHTCQLRQERGLSLELQQAPRRFLRGALGPQGMVSEQQAQGPVAWGQIGRGTCQPILPPLACGVGPLSPAHIPNLGLGHPHRLWTRPQPPFLPKFLLPTGPSHPARAFPCLGPLLTPTSSCLGLGCCVPFAWLAFCLFTHPTHSASLSLK